MEKPKKRFKKRYVALAMMALAIVFPFIVLFLISQERFQTYLATQLTKNLSEKYGHEIKIDKVKLKFFQRFALEGIYVADSRDDTLLYVQSANIKVKDIYWRKKNASFGMLELKNPYVNVVKLADGKMNFAHLKGEKKPPNKEKTDPNWVFNFDGLNVEKLRFHFDNLESKFEFRAYVPYFEAQVDSLDLEKQLIDIASIEANEPNISYTQLLRGDDIDNSHKDTHFLKDLVIRYKNVKINQGKFRFDNMNKAFDPEGIDFMHMNLSKIDIDVYRGRIVGDSIFGVVQHLSGQEKSGFVLNDFKSDVKVSNREVVCKDLDIITPESKIQDFLRLKYDSFPDFLDFVNKVEITAALSNTRLNVKDLNYFAKKLDDFDHNTLQISGDVQGKINHLRINNLVAEAGLKTELSGNASFYGLPNWKETRIILKVEELKSDANDIRRIYPKFKQITQLENLGEFRFDGHFEGYESNFVASGNLHSALGSATADIAMERVNSDYAYEGHLETENFNLGSLIGQKDVGKLSFDGDIKGTGTKLNTFDANIQGNVDAVEYKNYTYQNIKINGRFRDKTFNGMLLAHDKNLDIDFKGNVNLTDSLPSFNFIADLKKVQLDKLNLYKMPLEISGLFNVNMKGKTLENLVGNAQANYLQLKSDELNHTINNIDFNAVKYGNQKILDLKSDQINASLTTDVPYKKLQSFFIQLAENYSTKRNQLHEDSLIRGNIIYHAEVKNPGPLVSLVDSQLRHLDYLWLDGKYNSISFKNEADVIVQNLKYGEIGIKKLELTAQGDKDVLDLDANLDELRNKDSLLLLNSALLANFVNDTFYYDLKTLIDTSSAKSNYKVNLKGKLQTSLDTVYARISESELNLNNQLWQFKPGNLITYSKKYLKIEELILNHEGKDLYVRTTNPSQGVSNIELDLSDVLVNDLVDVFRLPPNNYKGLINGSVEVTDIFNNPSYFGNVFVGGLAVNDDYLGDLSVYSNYEIDNKRITIEGKLKGPDHLVLLNGFYLPSKNNRKLEADVEISKFKIDVINNFLAQYVTQSSGNATGKLKLSGTIEKPQLTGTAHLENCQTRVAFINTLYRLENEKVLFEPDRINFKGVKILDEEGDIAYGSGYITHKNLKKFELDLNVSASNFKMLDTDSKINKQFYGEAYLTGVAFFKGPFNNVDIHVQGSTTEGSHLSIPVLDYNETNRYPFIVFADQTKDSSFYEKQFNIKRSKLNLSLDLDVTRVASIELILDPATGDKLKVYGSGNIKVDYLQSADLLVYGEYKVESGEYLFTFQSLVNKPFKINQGSIINFTGDIYQTQLKVDAVYAINAAPYDLISQYLDEDQTLETSRAKNRTPVDLMLHLDGVLEKPEISFDILMKNVDPSIQNYIDNELIALKNNPNEMNKQVFGIILTQRFLPKQIGGSTLVGETASSTITEFLSTQLSNYINDWLNIFYDGVNFLFKYRPYSEISSDGVSLSNGNEVYVALSSTFFKDRLKINIGGNIDLKGNNASSTTSNKFNSDVSVEYSLTPDGQILLKAFNTSDVDQFSETSNATNVKTGLALSYRESFDNIADLKQQWIDRKKYRQQRREVRQKARATKYSSVKN